MKSHGARLEQFSFPEATLLRRQHVKLKSNGVMLGFSKILIFHLKYVQIISKCKYFIGNMCKCVPADPTCQFLIGNMCNYVPADPKYKYSIKNMCNWLGGHVKLCSRLGRPCVLHKKHKYLKRNTMK